MEVNVHPAQTLILRELLFRREASYTDLQRPTGMASDFFNFHVRRLCSLQLVEKLERGRYRLTPKGKEYANRLDTDEHTIERQPKVAVLLAIRSVDTDGVRYLFQERLKQPYFGYWGFPSGKVRWSETLLEAAARELEEETGLTAQLELKGIYHEHARLEETGELLEDKLFFVVLCTNVKGELITRFEGGANRWLLPAELEYQKTFTSYLTELEIAEAISFQTVEAVAWYRKEEF